MASMRLLLLGGSILVLTLASPSANAADWRDDVKVLRIGVLTADAPADDLARLEPYRAYLAEKIALPVELVPATTMATLIEAETSGRVQYAILSASGFAAASEICKCVEPLVLPAAMDGSRGFHAILLARADSKYQKLEDTDGARLALGASDSVAGRLLPLQEFAAAGLDPSSHFAALYESPGPADAIAALLDGRADVALAWSSLAGDPAAGYSFGPLAAMVAAGTLSMDQVRIIWQSPLIPFGPHAVRTDMLADEKTALRDALTAMAAEAPDTLDAVDRSAYGGGGFVAASAEEYAPLMALVAPPPAAAPNTSPAAR
jgi:phosphonate transport system substrate-binding protein